MKKNKAPSKTTLVLYGLCAAIWTLAVLMYAVRRAYEHAPALFVLNILAALIWIAAFIKWLKVYRRAKQEEQQTDER